MMVSQWCDPAIVKEYTLKLGLEVSLKHAPLYEIFINGTNSRSYNLSFLLNYRERKVLKEILVTMVTVVNRYIQQTKIAHWFVYLSLSTLAYAVILFSSTFPQRLGIRTVTIPPRTSTLCPLLPLI